MDSLKLADLKRAKAKHCLSFDRGRRVNHSASLTTGLRLASTTGLVSPGSHLERGDPFMTGLSFL